MIAALTMPADAVMMCLKGGTVSLDSRSVRSSQKQQSNQPILAQSFLGLHHFRHTGGHSYLSDVLHMWDTSLTSLVSSCQRCGQDGRVFPFGVQHLAKQLLQISCLAMIIVKASATKIVVAIWNQLLLLYLLQSETRFVLSGEELRPVSYRLCKCSS